MENFKDKKVAVLGLGIEGKDVVSFLLKEGAIVTIFDKKEESELEWGDIDKDSVKIFSGEGYLQEGLKDFDVIVRSPGIYRYIPEIVDAEKTGSIVTSAIKIFFERCVGKIIGVTGTKGKGTTSTLITEILKAGGREVFLSGNIGKPLLELIPQINESSIVVLEMSSFQLIDMTQSPKVAVVLNITTDHLDWHKDIEEYINAKKNIVSHQKQSDFAVINFDYDTPKSFATLTEAKVIPFTVDALDKKYKESLLLKGQHNLENIAAAVTVAGIFEVDEETILRTVKNFKGLEHRLELVDEINGVTFYNDSFATGPQPTMAAIGSFVEPETLILGGSEKGLDYSDLGKYIAGHGNVINVILIGVIGPALGSVLKKSEFRGNVINMGMPQMREVVSEALRVTPKGGVVILSPAAASFDMFDNYKERGTKFKEAVYVLKNENQ